MGKYIDKWQAVRNLMDAGLVDTKKAVDAIQYMKEDEVRPVMRGEWVESFPLEIECTRCKFRVKSSLKIWYKFCPNCGADMREPQEE